MIKRPPSRNNRSKSFKVKHVLQICLLLGVCFWLIYQVKHSHDKKKEMDEKDAKISVRAQSGNGIADFGRKGLYPHLEKVTNDEKHDEDDDEETVAEEESNKIEETKHEQKQVEDENKHEGEEQEEKTKTEESEREDNMQEEEEREGGNREEEEEREEENRHEEEESEEEGNKHEEDEREVEEEGNKHEDEEQEEETKSDVTEDDGRGGGDDEIDEHDQQKIEGEADHEEDFVDEEKEREEAANKERENDEGGDNKEDKVDREASTENEDHDGGTQNDHEAREVHYKADDASSAVTHDAQNIGIEPDKISSDSSNENSKISDLELEKNSSNNTPKDINGDQKNSISQLFGEGAMSENNHPLNVKPGEEKGDETINSEGQSLKKATDNQQLSTDKSVDLNTEADKNPTGWKTGISGTSQLKDTSDLNKPQNRTVDGADDVEASKLKTTELEEVNINMVTGSGESGSTSTVYNITENNVIVAKDSHPSTNPEPDGSSKTIKHEVTAEAEVDSGSSLAIEETEDAAEGENSNIKNESDRTYDNSGLSTTDETEAAVHDTIDFSDSSIGQDEKEARIDLDTLPENSAEGVNSRDAAAE